MYAFYESLTVKAVSNTAWNSQESSNGNDDGIHVIFRKFVCNSKKAPVKDVIQKNQSKKNWRSSSCTSSTQHKSSY